MHKDGDTHHEETSDKKPTTIPGPNDQADIIHQLMHNGENFIHNLLEENKPFRFNIAEIMKLGIDRSINLFCTGKHWNLFIAQLQ